jgi:DNA-binding CsgD family transcriptional regulator
MFVGRARELAALGALVDRAQAGPVEPVLLVGEAGMGKSALLDALADAARRRGMRVVRTRSPEGADASPFSVVEDVGRVLSDDLALLSHDDAQLLRRAPHDSTIRPGAVAGALLELLAESAHRQPLLLLLDDLHWADRDSVTTVCLAVGRLQSERVGVVGAARPRPAPDPRVQAWTRIGIGPLESAPAIHVLQQHLADLPERARPDDTHARVLADALGCCPLALVQAGNLLTPAQLAGTEPLPDPLPIDEHLTGAWGRVWEDLPTLVRTAILAFCVTAGSGSGVISGVLADLGLDQDALDPTASQHLLVPADAPLGVDLGHPLIRDAVLVAAGPQQVRGMHRRAAAVAQALGLSPSIVVAHLAASALPGDEQTIAQLLDQADRALALDVGEPAGRALLAAASLTLASPTRAHLAARAIEVLMLRSLTADFRPALALVDSSDADCLSPGEQLWIEWARSERLAAVDGLQHLASIRATAAHARATGSPILSWTLLSALTAAWGAGDAATASAHADMLLRLAERGGESIEGPLPAWACRALHAVNLFQVGRVAEAHDELLVAREGSRAWQPPTSAPSAQMVAIGVVDHLTGLLDPWVDDRLVAGYRWFLRNDGETVSHARCLQAERARRRAEFAVARDLLDEAVALFPSCALMPSMWLPTSVRIRAAIGDGEALHAEAAQIRAYARRIGTSAEFLGVADGAEGLLALGEGRIDDALLHLEPLAEPQLLGRGPWDVVTTGRADLVEALTRAGATDRAGQAAQALGTTLGPSPDPFARGLVHRVHGLTTSADQAQARLEASATAFREAGDPFEEARSRLLLGEWLRRERQIEPARRELRLAIGAFERMGAAPWYARAVAELRATRAAVPKPTPDPWSGLTPQERRVAEAVAAGGTDRQVAADLFLSARTVGYHLASIYRKLGVNNRTALAARLAQARTAVESGQPATARQ